MPLYFGDRADRRGARGEGYSPAERQEWIRNAAIRSLGGEVDRSILLVLEDLHWADQTTLEALCRLPEVGLSGPVLAVLISRPPLPGEATLAKLLDSVEHRIDLPPLSRENAHEFLEKLLGRHELPRAFLERVVDRAEGNPLFIEEMLKAILDSDAIQRDEDVWKATGDLASLDVPGTIESVLSTRIDGLDSASKSVLQYAAIVGRRFWGGVVSDALARRPVEKELGQLLEGAFVRALPFSTVTGDREFLFEHLLLQEVAYEGILRRLRSDLHGAVAAWLEERLGAQAEGYAEWIAFHYERSTEPERSLHYLKRAADTARERGSLSDARSLVQRALNLAKSAESKARLLGLTEDIAAEAGDVKARRDAIAELEALGAGDEEGRVAADAAYRRARLQLHSGDLSGAKANAEKALQRFEQLGDISMQADALRLLARVSHLWGDQREALKFYRSSLPLEREAGDRAGQAEVFDHLGLVQIDLDDFTTALDYFEAAREICAALAQNSEAASLARQVCDTALQTDQPGLGARGHLQLAQILSGQAGEEAARQARELARPSGLAHVDILALIREAEIALQEGDLGGAEEASAEAIHKLSMRGRIEGPEEAVLCTRARCLKALGRNDEASELLKQTREAIREKADKIEDPELRRSFLDIPLNRAVMGGETTRGETSR